MWATILTIAVAIAGPFYQQRATPLVLQLLTAVEAGGPTPPPSYRGKPDSCPRNRPLSSPSILFGSSPWRVSRVSAENRRANPIDNAQVFRYYVRCLTPQGQRCSGRQASKAHGKLHPHASGGRSPSPTPWAGLPLHTFTASLVLLSNITPACAPCGDGQ